jgi:hypothetical protein
MATQEYLDVYNTGKVGRPKKYRPAKRKSKKGSESEYTAELRKFMKRYKWSALCTATFDRRNKTPMSIYEHQVLMKEYLPYLDVDWEPTTWEPTMETAYYMMKALQSSLMQFSHKKWKIFYVIEEHKDGTPHIHFMVGNSRWHNDDVYLISRIWRYLRGGFIKVDLIKSDNLKAIDYCLKYVEKDLALDRWDILFTEPEKFRLKNFRSTYITYKQTLKIRENKLHTVRTGKKKRPPIEEAFSLDF